MSTAHTLMTGLRVLVVEDEPNIAAALVAELELAGCAVIGTADNGVTAIDIAISLRPEVILMDVHLRGDMDGIEAAERIYQRMPIPVIYLSGDGEDPTLERAKAASAYGYVLKPFSFRGLRVAIEVAVHRFRTEQRLAENRLTYSAILGSVSDAVVTTDARGRVLFMNGVAERLTGWRLENAQGRPAQELLQFANRGEPPAGGHVVTRVLASRAPAVLDPTALVVSGTSDGIPVDGNAVPVLDGFGRLLGITVTLRDQTEVRKAQADLQTMAERLSTVLDTAVDGVLLVDYAGTILMSNPACTRLFGYAADEIIGSSVESLMPSLQVAERVNFVPSDQFRQSAAEKIRTRAVRCRRRDGSEFQAELSIGEVRRDGRPAFVSVVHDVTKRRELEAALLEAIGNEQRRFGRDLHDGLGQDLTGLKLLLEAIAQRSRREGLPILADAECAMEIARDAIQTCRNVARGLSPVSDAQGGLVAGLRNLIGRLNVAAGPRVAFSVSNVEQLGLTPTTTEHLFRIAQEALSNALRHSRARLINVALDVRPAAVRLEICDDGEGLSVTGAGEAGLGLRTMRYRAEVIGAQFTIAPRDGAGTCVVCECPQAA